MGAQLELLIAAGATTTPDPSKALRDSLHPLSQMLVGLWPVWALLGLIAVGKLAARRWTIRRLSRAGMFEIDRMSGEEFEYKLAVMFRSLGYRVKAVGSSRGDFGGDLVVSKDGAKTVVQAKCWKKNVGVKAVQEAVAAKAVYGADSAMVVTNSRFTKQAQELASKNKVKLWGRDQLVMVLLKANKVNASPAELHPSLDAPPLSLTSASSERTTLAARSSAIVSSPSGAFCARCGEPVSVKVRDYCLADRERFGGLIYCFADQKQFRRR